MSADPQSRAVPAADPVLPRNCTFDAADWQLLARCWFPIALCRDVTTAPVAATLLDEALVLYRAGDEIVVADALCPHRGTPLSMAVGDGQSIACAYHGFRFGHGGRCIKVPAHPDDRIPAKLNLRNYPAVERYGLVWTRLREPSPEQLDDPHFAIPDMPDWSDPSFQTMTCPSLDIFGFAGRQIEGFLDVAHFAFVHPNTIGDANNPVVEPYTPALTDVGFEFEYRSKVGNYHIDEDRGRDGFTWLRHFRVHLPFIATLTIHFPEGKRLSMMNAASPVSARHTRLFAPVSRNVDLERPVDEVCAFTIEVASEDKAIVEAQRPEFLPLDPTFDAHIMADRASIAYRRGLRELGFSRFITA